MKYEWKVLGHSEVLNSLEKEIENKKITHAYLFSGPEGVGKLTVAENFAKILEDSIQERKILADDGNSIGIDEIRELTKDFSKSSYNERRIVIIENAERMTLEASNSILKFLEEPPSDVIIIFTTRNYCFLLSTIISRMRLFHFHLSDKDLMKKIADSSDILEENKEDALKIASGRVGTFKRFAFDPDSLFKERNKYREFEKISHEELTSSEIFEIAERITNPKNDGSVDEYFESLIFFLRSKMLKNAKRGEIQKAILASSRIKKIKESILAIKKNANSKLTFENLILNF